MVYCMKDDSTQNNKEISLYDWMLETDLEAVCSKLGHVLKGT